jgi:pimeloyl-ACP methyl ester carboxylesterase
MNLHFREMGEGSPLIILHGLFGSSDNWLSMAKQLAQNYHVYIIDQRNHGQSPHDKNWNYSLMANDIEEFCKQQNLSKIYIAGHSMGGKTVMKLAELFPTRILKMMIIDIAPRYYPVHHHEILKALKSLDFESINTRKQAEEVLQQSIDDFGTRQFLLKNIYWKSDEKLAWRFNLDVITEHIEIVGEATPTNDSLVCNIPTCFVKGQKSNYIKHEDELLITKQYPNATIVDIPNAGHWVHAENPLALLQTMLSFFTK